MKALVVAHGEAPGAALLHRLAREASLIIAADGGADRALVAGIVPALVTGDLDSVSDEARSRLPPAAFILDADPERTDLQKAIALATARGATAIDVVCAGGGRADHALANLSVLVLGRGGPRLRLLDDLFEVTLVEGEATVEGPGGTVVSLVAIGRCRGVTTRGLRWDLTEAELTFSPRGVHNEIVQSPASVRVASGDLLLFRGHWVEHHR